jgi:hypothetical protein
MLFISSSEMESKAFSIILFGYNLVGKGLDSKPIGVGDGVGQILFEVAAIRELKLQIDWKVTKVLFIIDDPIDVGYFDLVQ